MNNTIEETIAAIGKQSSVAATIEFNDSYGLQELFFQGKEAVDIIVSLQEYQDLSCLYRMAYAMGTEEDKKVAKELESFLSSPYGIDDFDKINFPFSIGSIKCTGWAKGEKDVQLLKDLYRKKSEGQILK